MTNALVFEEIGPPMRIDRAAPFRIYGQRFRELNSRTVLDLTGKTVFLRVGTVAQPRLMEIALTPDTSTPTDPFYYGTFSVEQTTVPAGIYEYVFVDSDGRVLLSGPAAVVDHTRPLA